MTRRKLAELIIETIDNFRSIGDPEAEIIDAVESYLTALYPKNVETFSKWGYPQQQSTVAECWPQNCD